MFEPSYWVASLVLSIVGLGLFVYGKRAPNLVVGIAGIALMGEPLFLFSGRLLWVVGSLTLAAMLAVQFVLARQRKVTIAPAETCEPSPVG